MDNQRNAVQAAGVRPVAQAHRHAALEFLKLVVAGRIEEAYDRYVDLRGKHHNAYFPAGFSALKKTMMESHEQFPQKQFTILRCLADEDLVAAHSRLKMTPEGDHMAVVHIFRFEDGKIVEMWDLGQTEPKEMPNKDGMF